MRIGRMLAIAGLAALPGWGQLPYINGHGIRNGGSDYPPALPDGAIAQGSIVTIYGAGLGPAAGVSSTAFPLSPSLAGVSVTATQGATQVNILPLYVSASQINAILPSNTPLGRVSLQVTYKAFPSNSSPATVVAANFGAFAINGAGFGPGVVTNYIATENQPVNAPGTSASAGQLVTLWGTGLGPVPEDDIAPSPGNLPSATEVFVGGVAATNILYHGRSPCCSGLDEIIFYLPQGAPMGCYVPVTVRINGEVMDNPVTMAITPSGGACSDANNSIEQSFLSGNSSGFISLTRSTVTLNTFVPQAATATGDYAKGLLFAGSSGPFFFEPLVSLPPLGSCTYYSIDGELQNSAALPGLTDLGTLLDAGSRLNLSSGSQSGTAPAAVPGTDPEYTGELGGSTTTFSAGPFFSPPGAVTVSAQGGGGAGQFQISVPTAPALQWTNQSVLPQVLDRTQPLTLTWSASGATGATVIAGGGNFDILNNASTLFLCAADAGAGAFTVPALVQTNIPATRISETTPNGAVFLGLVPMNAPATFSAANLMAGFGLYSPWVVQSVAWK